MIKKFGTSIKKLGTRILILLIALSFAVWGIGDIFTGDTNPTIATVGKSKIKLNDFNLEYQTILNNLRQNNNEPIPEEFIKSLGIHKSVLNNMINTEYVNLLSKKLGIAVSNKDVRKAIIQNKNFHDQLGVFNKEYFNYFLNRNNLSEKELIIVSEKNLINDVFIKTISSTLNTSEIIAENIKKKMDLARKAEIYEVDTTSMIIDRKISEDQIRKHYDEIKSTLLIPEERDISIIYISNKNIDTTIDIKESEILEIYKANKNDYETPEKRKFLQFIFNSEVNAKNFTNEVKNINDINNFIIKNKLDKNSIDLGYVSKNDLDPEISDIAFSLNQKNFSRIIKTAFGWKVLYLEKIKPGIKTSFNIAKEKIKKDLITDMINEKIFSKANMFYEKFLETNDLSSSLKYSKLDKKSFKRIQINNLRSLKNEEININQEELIKTIFNLKQGGLSEPLEAKESNLFFIYLDKVIKSSPKPLDNARQDVINSIYKKLRRDEAMKIADSVYNKLIKNKLADKSNYNLIKTDWITNDSRLDSKIDPKIKNIIFKTQLNKFSKINEVNELKFVFVRPFKQTDKILDKEKRSKIKNILLRLDNDIDNDILNALLLDIKSEKKSSVNQNFLNSF